MSKALVHFLFKNTEGEMRHSIILNDRETGEDELLVCATPFTNFAFDYAEKKFEELQGPVIHVLFEVEKRRKSVLARKRG